MAYKITFTRGPSIHGARMELPEKFDSEEKAQKHIMTLLMRRVLTPLMHVRIEQEETTQ